MLEYDGEYVVHMRSAVELGQEGQTNKIDCCVTQLNVNALFETNQFVISLVDIGRTKEEGSVGLVMTVCRDENGAYSTVRSAVRLTNHLR